MPSAARLLRPVTLLGLFLAVIVAVVLWMVVARLMSPPAEGAARKGGPQAAPVEVAQIERGTLEQRRTFSGTLAPRAEAAVAPKIGGRIQSITVNLGDIVQRGQIVAVLDDAEAEQAVAQAEAELAVAEANVAEANSALTTAMRDYERVQTLSERGVASESQLDVAEAAREAAQAELAVSEAQVRRSEAALAAAKIRLGYTQVEATWAEGDGERVVAERLVDAGDTVSANTPLLRVVELDPLDAVVYVTEKDYGRLQIGQEATLSTDAFPRETFGARIARLAPEFRQSSRQARVELEVANDQRRLKPGMFARVTIVLDRLEDATIIPTEALVSRAGQMGVFVVDEETLLASFCPVEVLIQQPDRAAVAGEGLVGRVVTLGQQLLEDGSAVTIPGDAGNAGIAATQPAAAAGREASWR